MYEVDLEKAEEPEIELPTSATPQKKQGNSRKKRSASLTTKGREVGGGFMFGNACKN